MTLSTKELFAHSNSLAGNFLDQFQYLWVALDGIKSLILELGVKFIRSSALVGVNCVVGNSVELKNVLLFDRVQVPHYTYVGGHMEVGCNCVLNPDALIGPRSCVCSLSSVRGVVPAESIFKDLGQVVAKR